MFYEKTFCNFAIWGLRELRTRHYVYLKFFIQFTQQHPFSHKGLRANSEKVRRKVEVSSEESPTLPGGKSETTKNPLKGHFKAYLWTNK